MTTPPRICSHQKLYSTSSPRIHDNLIDYPPRIRLGKLSNSLRIATPRIHVKCHRLTSGPSIFTAGTDTRRSKFNRLDPPPDLSSALQTRTSESAIYSKQLHLEPLLWDNILWMKGLTSFTYLLSLLYYLLLLLLPHSEVLTRDSTRVANSRTHFCDSWHWARVTNLFQENVTRLRPFSTLLTSDESRRNQHYSSQLSWNAGRSFVIPLQSTVETEDRVFTNPFPTNTTWILRQVSSVWSNC